MPTTRPRHFVTETDELAAALDAAAKRWPDLSRPQLILRLALSGSQVEEASASRALEERRRLVQELSGSLSGCYGPNYLAELREDWPE